MFRDPAFYKVLREKVVPGLRSLPLIHIWHAGCAAGEEVHSMALINAYVAHYYSTETWVNFKLWGYAFPLIFIVGQGIYISRHLSDEEAQASAGVTPGEPERR